MVKRLSIGAYLGLARFCFALKPGFGLTGLKNQQFVRGLFPTKTRAPAVPLRPLAGVGSLTPIAKVAATWFILTSC